MPIQPVDFPMLNFEQANPLIAGIMAGQKIGQSGRMFPEDLRKAQLANALAKIQNKYAEPMAQSELALKKAQLPYMEAQTGLLNKDLQWYDPKIASLIALQGSQAGLNSADIATKRAELPYVGRSAEANAAYKEAMAKYLTNPNQMLKGMTPLGKSYLESSLISQMPGQQGPQAPSEVQDAYNLYRQKMTTDSSARQKNLYATNIEKTLSFINPDDLTRYSGASGALEKKLEEAQAPFGKQSKNYDSYQKSLDASKLLASQVRQFYGDSIQPDMIARLEALTNPSVWSKDPKLAKQIFQQTKDILGQELGTYRQSMKSTRPYESQESSGESDPLGLR